MQTKGKTLSQRNYKFFMIEGTLFWVGISIISQDGVVPLFIFSYTGSLALVGVAATVRTFFNIAPQILLAHKIGQIKDMPRFISKVMFMTRTSFLLMVPVLFFINKPRVIVGLYLLITALYWGGHSLVGVIWNHVLARTVDSDLRGKVHGYQQLFGGLGGILTGYMVKRLLDSPVLSQEQIYMIIFGLSGLVMLASSAMTLGVKDAPRQIISPKTSSRAYLMGLKRYLKGHKSFKLVTLVSASSKTLLLANPFMILVAKNILHVEADYVSTLIYLQIIGALVGGFLWGNISQRFGNRVVIVLSSTSIMACALLVCVTILASGTGFSPVLIGICVFVGGINATSWLGYLNYTMDIAKDEERVDLLVLQNFLMLPLSIMGYLIGLSFSLFGYLSVFVIVALFAMVALYFAKKLEKVY